MKIFKYKLEHDFGLAPNPFWGTMTLAVCKGQIRRSKNLQLGDWIIGSGSQAIDKRGKLLYAMEVQRKITMQEYWDDPEFNIKRPIVNGSLAQMYGDNFYHKDENGKWIQEPSAHSEENFTTNEKHLKKDTDGEFVLISNNFYYFGDNALDVPDDLKFVITDVRNIQLHYPTKEEWTRFLEWLSQYEPGIHGDPANWKINYHLEKLNIYEE